MKRTWVVGLFWFTASQWLGAAGADLSLPLGADSIRAYLEANPQATVESFLQALPPSYSGSFVLMHRSRSLQPATYDRPRVIFFGPDARFLLAVGNKEKHPRFSVLEFAEFEEKQGTYRFGEIDLGTIGRPKVSVDNKVCTTCHGSPTRPIWGQYPRWDGAYSDEAGKITAADRAGFAQFLGQVGADPRYQPLMFSAGTGDTLLLTDRYYPFANTSFNHELGNTVALGTLTRMRAAPHFAADRWAVLASSEALECIRTDAWFDISPVVQRRYAAGPASQYPATGLLSVKAMRLMGIDPETELSLEEIVPRLKRPELSRTYGKWQTGAFRLDEALTFALLMDTAAQDSQLSKLIADEAPVIARLQRWMPLKGEERATALRKLRGDYNFFDVYDPIIRSRSRHETFCAYLASKL